MTVQEEFAAVYAAMTDEELGRLAADRLSLTDGARDALDRELSKRAILLPSHTTEVIPPDSRGLNYFRAHGGAGAAASFLCLPLAYGMFIIGGRVNSFLGRILVDRFVALQAAVFWWFALLAVAILLLGATIGAITTRGRGRLAPRIVAALFATMNAFDAVIFFFVFIVGERY